MPELLKAILDINPNVFNGQHAGNKWNNHNYAPKFNGISPTGSYAQYSPQSSVQNSPSTGACVPSRPPHVSGKPSNVLPPQPSPHVTMASPPSQSTFLQPATSAPQSHSPVALWNSDNSMDNSVPQHSQTTGRASVITEQKQLQHPQNGGYFTGMPSGEAFDQMLSQTLNVSDVSVDKDPLSLSPPRQMIHEPQASANLHDETFRRRGTSIRVPELSGTDCNCAFFFYCRQLSYLRSIACTS